MFSALRRPVVFLLGLAVVWSAALWADFFYEAEVPIVMKDGTILPANIARPAEEGAYPVVLLRTPYGKPGKDNGDMQRYARAGYAIVMQDCRGTGKAEGEWEPFRDDPQDGHDTHAWIAAQAWCNGRIGLAGGSYVGWTQWASLPGAHPAVRCAVPIVPFAEAYPDLAYYGGAFQMALLMGWGGLMGGASLTEENVQEIFRYQPLNTFGNQFTKPVPYLNDWIAHPLGGDYWAARGINGRYDDVETPILNIGGWYDIFSKPVLDLCTRVRHESKNRLARRNQFVIVGPWAHGVDVQKVGELDFGKDAKLGLPDLQFEWLEYWLKDEETGVQEWPPYKLFVMGENCWRNEYEWPLARTRYTPFYLHSQGKAQTRSGDGLLNLEKPGSEEASDSFVYDPDNPVPTAGGNNLFGAPAGPFDQSAVEDRDDVLVYSSEVLEEDLEVTGPVTLVLYAASSARDTDFTAKLLDVHPDGKAYNLCDGIIRASRRPGQEENALLTPGVVEEFSIDLWVTSNLFKAGHRIRVEISSSNFPRFDRNPNSGLPFGTDTELHRAEQQVFHSETYPSHILLPVIPR
ncbi:MAG: CocE/NonD family hydrolase [Candidatus Hydrogenedens sp.]|jgi:putative CocE/NonD family hydrolase|nr:CocE/NonD family hydrolase [Candidatus Hydrogenedens sp.]